MVIWISTQVVIVPNHFIAEILGTGWLGALPGVLAVGSSFTNGTTSNLDFSGFGVHVLVFDQIEEGVSPTRNPALRDSAEAVGF